MPRRPQALPVQCNQLLPSSQRCPQQATHLFLTEAETELHLCRAHWKVCWDRLVKSREQDPSSPRIS